jgi:hypothetical protein
MRIAEELEAVEELAEVEGARVDFPTLLPFS